MARKKNKSVGSRPSGAPGEKNRVPKKSPNGAAPAPEKTPTKTSAPAAREPQAPTPEDRRRELTIVAIGASAGGLEAFEQFFNHMPPDSGMAFILIPHLDPSHSSMLPDLLRRFTQMK